MKLFFDARYTRLDYHDGISRYSAELGNALLRLPEFQSQNNSVTFLICDEKQKQWFPANATFLKIHAPTSLKEPWTARILNRHAPDVVYSPMQTIGLGAKRFKAILTVHDMIYYRHKTPPKNLPFFVRIGWRLYHTTYWPERLLLRRADAVTTVSNTSANELMQARMTNQPVTVIYNAPQSFTTHPVTHKATIEHIVYMGSFMPYKNVETLIRGMAELPGKTLHLLSRITPQRQAELQAIVPRNAQVIFHGGVSDDEYEALLANNALLATASLDEGYGIPVAEAMNSGVPVVVSDIPVFREVGGDGALYFAPRSPEAFAEQVKKLDTPALRDAMIEQARLHIASFQWERSAQTLATLIRSLMTSVKIK